LLKHLGSEQLLLVLLALSEYLVQVSRVQQGAEVVHVLPKIQPATGAVADASVVPILGVSHERGFLVAVFELEGQKTLFGEFIGLSGVLLGVQRRGREFDCVR